MSDAIVITSKSIVGYDDGDWYEVLVEDCKAIIVEARFNACWSVIEGHHKLGERIVTDTEYKRHEQNKSGELLARVRKDLNMSESTLYRAIQFYRKYPELEMLPVGKDWSWRRIVNELLPEGSKGQDAEAKVDEAEELRKLWGVERGQVWTLGNHRLYCGDAYSDLSSLIGKDKVGALITDPPYGIGYKPNWNKWDGSSSDFKQVIGDDGPFDPTPFLSYPTVLLFGASHYSNRLPIGGWLCWDKRTDDKKDGMIGSPFELAWFRSVNTTKKSIMIRVLHGGVVNADSNKGNNEKRYHSTQKPVALMEKIVQSLTNKSEVILDPFAGSGSTLLACDNIGRKCLAMEIDPCYVAVILHRWGDATGKPVLVGDGNGRHNAD